MDTHDRKILQVVGEGGGRLGDEVRILPNLGSGQRLHKSLFSSLWRLTLCFRFG